MKTVKQLNDILEKERKMIAKGQLRSGAFGIEECKKSIKFKLEMAKGTKTLNDIYYELVIRGLKEFGFNTTMIIACEEMMTE